MRLAALALALPLLLLGPGCQYNALHEARMTDTPEAYEAFLEKYPSHEEAQWMRKRIDELRFLKAKDAGTAEALRNYVQTHPDGEHVNEAATLEDELAFKEAVEARTAEALQGYLDSHPEGKFVKKARDEYDEALYRDRVVVENLEVKRVNLANDPEGPLNGWGVFGEVRNGGDRTLIEVEIEIHYLDAGDNSLESRTWWPVAPGLEGMPTPPQIVPPLPPGEARPFKWTLETVKDGWTEQVRVDFTNLRFAGEE